MIVFLTLYLGLVNGVQPVALQAGAEVKSIRVVVDGKTAVTMSGPPWRNEIDFGPDLLPHEVVAVALDAKGGEMARARQLVNVPRAPGEIEIAVERNAQGRAARARIVARHVAQHAVRKAAMKLDDAPLQLDKDLGAALPAVDAKRPHLLVAEVQFSDRTVARREVVFGGEFGDSAEAQITPIAVVKRGADDAKPADGCFSANGAPLHVRSIDDSAALVMVVRDPVPPLARGSLNLKGVAVLDRTTYAQLFSPIASHVRTRDESTVLFPTSETFDVAKTGMVYLLTSLRGEAAPNEPRQWADAVAVAASAAAGPVRRAVVLVLGDAPDASDHDPATVRRYLAAIGVPLFVWSVAGPRADLAARWGDVEDVSTVANIATAAARLRRALAEQRIAWIEADPVTAFRATIAAGCGYARAAR